MLMLTPKKQTNKPKNLPPHFHTAAIPCLLFSEEPSPTVRTRTLPQHPSVCATISTGIYCRELDWVAGCSWQHHRLLPSHQYKFQAAAGQPAAHALNKTDADQNGNAMDEPHMVNINSLPTTENSTE